MAFDTVIDKTQLETAMTATADAIREKTGSTAECTWDTSAGFASLIAAIESGGVELPGTISAMAVGTYTPTSTQSSTVTFTHGLGVIPNFVLVFAGLGMNTPDDVGNLNPFLGSMGLVRSWTIDSTKYTGIEPLMHLSMSGVFVTSNLRTTSNNGYTKTKATIPANTAHTLKYGITYYWICGKITA